MNTRAIEDRCSSDLICAAFLHRIWIFDTSIRSSCKCGFLPQQLKHQTPSKFQFVARAETHLRVAFLPWVPVRLKALKPKETDFESKTLGEHILRVRLERGLKQTEVADILKVNPWTLGNWEKGSTEPVVAHYPAIMSFLGYCPWMPADTFGKQIYRCRVHLGLSIRAFARQLEVDPATVSRWEVGKREPIKAIRHLLKERFGIDLLRQR